MNDNRYHSPEESQTDSERPDGDRRVIIKDLRWRSSTVSLLLLLGLYQSVFTNHFFRLVNFYEIMSTEHLKSHPKPPVHETEFIKTYLIQTKMFHQGLPLGPFPNTMDI